MVWQGLDSTSDRMSLRGNSNYTACKIKTYLQDLLNTHYKYNLTNFTPSFKNHFLLIDEEDNMTQDERFFQQ